MKSETFQQDAKAAAEAFNIDWEKLGGAIPGFSCVRMKDEGAARVRAKTAGMTVEEELSYWLSREREYR
jgi:hypothetical protein